MQSNEWRGAEHRASRNPKNKRLLLESFMQACVGIEVRVFIASIQRTSKSYCAVLTTLRLYSRVGVTQ